MKTHLLIDADVIAFSSAAAAQQVFIGDNGWAQHIANTKVAEAITENSLFSLKQGLGADSFELILTDPTDNWRKSVDPSYKAARHDQGEAKLVRPLLLDYLKDYLREKHGAYHWPGLEADDVLSVRMTAPWTDRIPIQGIETANVMEGFRFICVGRDKDFKTIPGLHHTWKQDLDSRGNMLVREVSQWEADRFHLMQTLAGDMTDGFRGCPGIGLKRAAEIIDQPTRLVPQEGVKTRGKFKGEGVTRWFAEPTRDYWACVVSHYRKAYQVAGLDMERAEADALTTARLARLLRHGEYDPETEELRLWEPGMLKGVGRQ